LWPEMIENIQIFSNDCENIQISLRTMFQETVVVVSRHVSVYSQKSSL
jgi:hypothetical protein